MALYFQEITDKVIQCFFENICQADVSFIPSGCRLRVFIIGGVTKKSLYHHLLMNIISQP